MEVVQVETQLHRLINIILPFCSYLILLATAEKDYTGLPSIVSFVTGQFLSCIMIDIIDDKDVESKETISLILQPLDSSPGLRISRRLSTVEIIDNDINAGMANFNAKYTTEHI